MVTTWMKGQGNSKSHCQVLMNVNIKSIQDEDSSKIYVGSLKICCNPNCVTKASILASFYCLLSCFYQFSDFTLKSPKTAVRNRLWLATSSRVNSRLSGN